MGAEATSDRLAALLRTPGAKVAIAAHRNPDGDALGSVLGIARHMRAAGADVVLWHCDGHAVPDDLAFVLRDGERFTGEIPADAHERALIALDCATADRLDPDGVRGAFASVVNIDHHHDNTHFGDLNQVNGSASSTAEMVLDLILLTGTTLTEAVAEPLYVGIVTDTGRFGYESTHPATHRAVARIIEAGVDCPALHRRLYEDRRIGATRLLGRAIERLHVGSDGRFARSILRSSDFADAGSDEADGVAELLRGLRGIEVSAVVRAADPEDATWRVSMRSRDGRIDVSAIARQHGGGGHAAAAGCTVSGGAEAVLDWLDTAVSAALAAPEVGGPGAAAHGENGRRAQSPRP